MVTAVPAEPRPPHTPEQSVNYTAGVAFDTGPFNFTGPIVDLELSTALGGGTPLACPKVSRQTTVLFDDI